LCYTAYADNLYWLKCRQRRIAVSTTVQVRSRGVLTLPASLREKYNIQSGDTFQVLDLDGLFVLTPMVPMVPELAREIERARLEAGLGVEELLTALREQRERYYRETYQADPTLDGKSPDDQSPDNSSA
jgi:bifunctional DNA-binding transcriptional regulator/antitoxin component of YhaV-PrlF toxin-antitoxin module